MNEKKKKYNKKVVLYSLGLGALALGAMMTQVSKSKGKSSAQMSPAQKSMKQSAHKQETPTQTKLSASKNNATYRAHHSAALKSMGPKNRTTFHALPESDQHRVVKAHAKGKSAQGELTKVLSEDQRKHETKKSSNIYD
ncbi:hypothetical protein K0U07_02145 [bacterium]|nr:hypothetical protein [bacterium]